MKLNTKLLHIQAQTRMAIPVSAISSIANARSHVPQDQEDDELTGTANSVTDTTREHDIGQGSAAAVMTAAKASSGVHDSSSSEKTIVNGSSSTVAKQLPTARHSGSDDDDHGNIHLVPAPDEEEADGEPASGSGVNRVGPESKSSAFVSDFEAAAAALRVSEELPSSN